MTLQLLHPEFPYIWGKFDFLFYQCAMKLFPLWLSMRLDVHIKTVNFQNLNAGWAYAKIHSPQTQCAMKSFPRMLSKRWNCFCVCSARACYNFWKLPKNQIKMQFLTINQNFEKSSRILSNRRTFYQKNCFDTSQQNIGSAACAQSPRKCSNIEILGKESKFISKVDQGPIRVLRQNVASHNVYVTKRNCY